MLEKNQQYVFSYDEVLFTYNSIHVIDGKYNFALEYKKKSI